jgi:hypothetical protein
MERLPGNSPSPSRLIGPTKKSAPLKPSTSFLKTFISSRILIPTDFNVARYGWIPDIFIREDAGAGLLSNTKYTNMLLRSNGSLYNEAFGDIMVMFSPVVDYYPYDK